MIQAPNVQYIPAQQPMQTSYPQQGANNAVQYNQTPGVIYNYPTTSCYMPTQNPYCTDKSQFNGVNIEILNPQGQGLTPQNGIQMPAQFMPVQQPIQMPYYPQMPASQAIVQAPQIPAQVPAPQIQQPTAAAQVNPGVSSQTTPAEAQQTPAATQTAPQTAAPVVEQPVAPDASQTPESFAGKLKSTDLAAQKAAIEEVADTVKNNETLGPVLLDTQVFDALVDIIDKDTSSLQGPTPEIIELRQKPQEELSEEDKTKAKTPTPLESAEINKQYALYTISYMQERLNNELEKRNGKALPLKDLPCIEKVIDTAKSNPNPMLRIGAIAALSHIQRPEYKDDLNVIFELAKSDEDARVQEAATKAIELLTNNTNNNDNNNHTKA